MTIPLFTPAPVVLTSTNASTTDISYAGTNIAGTSGLLINLRNSGSAQVVASPDISFGYSTSGGTAYTAGGATTRIMVNPPVNSSYIRLVYSNHSGANSSGEFPGASVLKIKATFETGIVNTPTSETGTRTKVYFNGLRRGSVQPQGLLISDPIPVTITAGVPFYIRTYVLTPGNGIKVVTGGFTQGGTGVGSLNDGSGFATINDTTDSGTITQTTSQVYGPISILGWVPNAVKSIAFYGDSIIAGTTGDGGYGGLGGGFGVRMAQNQLARTRTFPVTPTYPYINLGRGSEQLTTFVTNINSSVRIAAGELCTTWWSNYGTNDLAAGRTLVQIQADMLTFAKAAIIRGKYFIQSTILPRTTSSDSWATVANQTAVSYEAIRQTVNSWLRDSSVNGFISQTGSPSLVQVHEACATVEVNSSGNLSLNGGFWLPAISGNPLASFTLTSGSTATLLNDTSQTWTQDQWRGYVALMTSGTQSGIAGTIFGNSPTSLSIQGALGSPSTGNTGQIIHSYTQEGTHPSSEGATLIAASAASTVTIN